MFPIRNTVPTRYPPVGGRGSPDPVHPAVLRGLCLLSCRVLFHMQILQGILGLA